MRLTLRTILMSLIALPSLQAAIVYSSIQDITIPISAGGVYIDFTDPSDATAFTSASSEPANWDLNPILGGAAFGTSDTFEVVTSDGTTNSTLQNLATSVIVGDGLGEGDSFVTGFSGSSDHMDGTGSGEFVAGMESYIGFRLDDGASGVYYGWMRVTLRDDGSVGTLHDWAWDTSGAAIQVGQIPEPSVILLSAVGTLLLLRRRR